MRAVLKEATHLAIDIPDFTGKGGTSTTGNVIHSLLSDENKLQVLVSQVPEQFQDKLHDCISRGYAIVKLYNSSEKINVPVFKDFCFTTKKLFLTSFNDSNNKSWIYLTKTVHGLLEHSSELLEANNCEGLGKLSESSLECNNKILRIIRMTQSRKCSQVENLNECMSRLRVRSDIRIRNAVPQKKIIKSHIDSRENLPYSSLSEYFIKELVLD